MPSLMVSTCAGALNRLNETAGEDTLAGCLMFLFYSSLPKADCLVLKL
jgi:hypothetical protein